MPRTATSTFTQLLSSVVVIACESLHLCTVRIWRCELARFLCGGFYAPYTHFHSSYILYFNLYCIVARFSTFAVQLVSSLRVPFNVQITTTQLPIYSMETARLSFGNYAEDKSQFTSTFTTSRFLIIVFKSQVNPEGHSYRDQFTASLLDLGAAQGCRNRYDRIGKNPPDAIVNSLDVVVPYKRPLNVKTR